MAFIFTVCFQQFTNMLDDVIAVSTEWVISIDMKIVVNRGR
jgi:hypothetical protein